MERNTFNIIFYVRKNKVKKDEEASLFIRLTINGRRWDSALKIKIDHSKWDAKRQVAISDNDEAELGWGARSCPFKSVHPNRYLLRSKKVKCTV
jgi:hypothetical protein